MLGDIYVNVGFDYFPLANENKSYSIIKESFLCYNSFISERRYGEYGRTNSSFN